MASYIGQVKIGNSTYPVGSMLYGECSTEAGDGAKVVTLSNFDTLATGITVYVHFLYSNTAENPTLKVGSTAAKSIKRTSSHNTPRDDGAPLPVETGSVKSWDAGAIVPFTYDGTRWVMNNAYAALPNTSDSAVSGKYVSSVSQENGKITVTKADFSPSVSITAGTSSAAPKVNITVNDKSGTAQSITTASTSVYGVTKLSSATDSTSADLAATASAVKAAYDLASGKQDPITFNSTYNASTNKAATMSDISSAVAGLTGAMHFIGTSSTTITDGGTQNPTIGGSAVTTKSSGDVVIYGNQEYVWNGSAWELLGDEGSYALKSNTATVVKTATLTKNTLPSLTVSTVNIPNVTAAGTAASLTTTTYSVPNVTAPGSASSFSVASGTLTITPGSAPTLGTAFSIKGVNEFTANTPATLGTEISVGSASGWNAGSQASLTTTNETVVVPGT